ncbi:MAG: phosphotransferase [Gemmatimonadota bacterium]
MRCKRFPPRWGNALLPAAPRGAALAGLALHSACRPRALVAQRAAWTLVRLFGTRSLPGPVETWDPPMTAADWAGLTAGWQADLGAFDGLAVYGRPRPGPAGFAALLLKHDRPLAFVKFRAAGDALERERRAHVAIWNSRPRAFAIPEPLGAGQSAAGTWFAVRPLPPRLHRPAFGAPLGAILDEVRAGLVGGVAAPAGTPDHWQPIHGDFTPWNLRDVDQSVVPVLIDWEDAGWAPPGADEVLFRATEAALRGHRRPPSGAAEAIDFWRRTVSARSGTARDKRLAGGVLAALHGMAGK